MTFDRRKSETWDYRLTLVEAAEILRTTPKALQQSVYRRTAMVMPVQHGPMLWDREALRKWAEGDVAYLAHATQRNLGATLRMSVRARKAG